MNQIIDCKTLSNIIRNEVKLKLKQIPAKLKLVVIKVGDDPASEIYVRQKEKACYGVGIDFERIDYPKDAYKYEILNKIKELNEDYSVTSILLQLPLPNSLSDCKDELINMIDSKKDVDGLTIVNKMRNSQKIDGIIPCTALGIMKIFDYLIDNKKIASLVGKDIVVIGKSDLIGRPLSYLLYDEATITHCDINTKDLNYYVKKADIVITTTGVHGLIKASTLKKGAILIDAGIVKLNGKVVGDAIIDSDKKDILYTSVPGGVGVMTVTGVLLNVIECYKKKNFDINFKDMI